jgi:hypothetical protein
LQPIVRAEESPPWRIVEEHERRSQKDREANRRENHLSFS